MACERWGTYSVIDHKNAAALVPEILMYDRLVLPYPSTPEDRKNWNEWDADLLDKRIEKLGKLAVKARWGNDQHRKFQDWMEKLERVEKDVENMVEETREKLPYAITRHILAEEDSVLPEGVTRITKVAAYQSEAALQHHFTLEANPVEQDMQTLGYLLAHRLAVPDHKDPEEAMLIAIKLATEDHKFIEHRQNLYDWQEDRIAKGKPPADAAAEMNDMITAYNKSVEKAVKSVYYKYAFTIATIGLGFLAGGLFNPMASGAALIAIVKFAKFDRTPVVDAGRNAPAAMFHDVESSYKRFRLA